MVERDRTEEHSEPGYSSLTRRERLERIADAERDRRAGRREVAIATVGEPTEWPARAVLTLSLLSDLETEPRRLLEEGLDLWARNAGLGDLNEPSRVVASESSADFDEATDRDDEEEIAPGADAEPDPLGFDLATHPLDSDRRPDPHADLDSPLDVDELERAFAEAETEVEAMHNVNEVAERVLLDEPMGLADFATDDLTPVDEADAFDVPMPADELGMDAAYVAPANEFSRPADREAPKAHDANVDPRQQVVIATLESWLRNLESRRAGRA